MADRVGQRLGNYRLIRLLGQGGFAQVYLGEHIHLETLAAIKVLNVQITGDDVVTFRREARTIARLEHPHIVRVLDFGVEGTTPFLVTTYAANGTLRQQHPKGSRLSLEAIVHYIKQVSDALQYAHDHKFIHRDVKPENMLLGSKNDVLLSDFGLAVIVHSDRSLITQETAGTVAYMAPEQIQGIPRPASDQYSLGIVVYEWLCGTRPFEGTTMSIFYQHLHMPPPALHEQLPMISSAVEEVVLKALAKDPKQRFASIQTFARALEQANQMGQGVLSFYPGATIAPNQILRSPEPDTPLDQLRQQTERIPPLRQSFLPTGESIPTNQPQMPSQIAYMSQMESIPHPFTVWTTPFVTVVGLTLLLTIGIGIFAFNAISGSDHFVEAGLSLVLLLIAFIAWILTRDLLPRVILGLTGLGAMTAAAAFSLQAFPVLGLSLSPLVQFFVLNRLLSAGLAFSGFISLLWVTRPFTCINRVVLLIIFGIAVVCTLLQYPFSDFDVIKHLFLLVALVALIQGVIIAAQIERQKMMVPNLS